MLSINKLFAKRTPVAGFMGLIKESIIGLPIKAPKIEYIRNTIPNAINKPLTFAIIHPPRFSSLPREIR